MQHFPGGSFVKLGSAMSLLTGKRMKISYLQAKHSQIYSRVSLAEEGRKMIHVVVPCA